MFKTVTDIYRHDARHYIKVIFITSMIAILLLIIARQIDINSEIGSSITESVLNIVSPDPIGFLIGVYAISLGILAITGKRIDHENKAPMVFIIIRSFFKNVAEFSKDTTFAFCGFLIACGIVSAIFYSSAMLIPSLAVTLVMLLIYVFFDFTYRAFDVVCGSNRVMVYLQEVLLGMILIGLSFPIFATAYERVM